MITVRIASKGRGQRISWSSLNNKIELARTHCLAREIGQGGFKKPENRKIAMFRITGAIPNIDYRLTDRYMLEELLTLSKRLILPERIIVRMRFQHGYTFAEIGSVLGVNESTASRRLKKICKKILKMK